MGTKGKAIVGVDVAKLLDMLNKAYADEWLAYYQYWVGAKVASGRMRGIVAGELEEHANEELEHAQKLVERMITLGGTPLLTPEALLKESGCGYDAPTDPCTKTLLKQNIKGEQCAIATYSKLLDFVKDKDPITYHLVLEILEDEVKHEEDLESLLADMA
ncbi:MAG: ferritin [Candidatus Auribacter fodinae]|jgi:bacterioferritin|uniref:Ferritin n=1 Tax=Candidatus Auribacter fodinae TaxID=2093366 RepID=A0A3A4R3C9_9BACT|nr:MAG: ferritin [Candidatus Auribacter fodinae]